MTDFPFTLPCKKRLMNYAATVYKIKRAKSVEDGNVSSKKNVANY